MHYSIILYYCSDADDDTDQLIVELQLVVSVLCGTRSHLTFATPLLIPSVVFLKLTASSGLSAPPSGSPKCLRFGLWLTRAL